MSCRSRIPPSAAFDAIAQGAQFRDRIAIATRASPEAIFRALHDVRLRDMKIAWLLGEIRYLPSRLRGHIPPTDTATPFFETLTAGGTLVLHDDTPREIITGSAAQLHRVNQAPRRFASREEFEAFADPQHEKLFMSIRVAPTGLPGEYWLVLEHATHALSSTSEHKFERYWRVIKPTGAFVSGQLLRAVRRRAERVTGTSIRPRQVWRSVRASKDEQTRVLPCPHVPRRIECSGSSLASRGTPSSAPLLVNRDPRCGRMPRNAWENGLSGDPRDGASRCTLCRVPEM